MSQNNDAIALFQEGKIKEAFCMAKRFTMSFEPEELDIIKLGYECILRPEFYEQLGKDPETRVAEATLVFEKFMKNYQVRELLQTKISEKSKKKP